MDITSILIHKGCYEVHIKRENFFKYALNRKVCIKYNFKIDKYEVSYKKAIKYDCNISYIPTIVKYKSYNLPVFNISYDNALKCCQKMGGDLPTPKEWSVVGIMALKNFDFNNSFNDFVEVESAKKTGKLYGIFGNVWEMTKSNNDKVILKGGSFYTKKDYFFNPLLDNLVLKKYISSYEDVGFRCVYRDKN